MNRKYTGKGAGKNYSSSQRKDEKTNTIRRNDDYKEIVTGEEISFTEEMREIENHGSLRGRKL